MKKIGIALGAGGAKGLAHVLILEALDELGPKTILCHGNQYRRGCRRSLLFGIERKGSETGYEQYKYQ